MEVLQPVINFFTSLNTQQNAISKVTRFAVEMGQTVLNFVHP